MFQNASGQWVLEGGPAWSRVYPNGVVIEGEDLVARNVRMTYFAGGNDPNDNSKGAWGDDLSDPSAVAVSLPHPTVKACKDPPLPSLPHNATVRVYSHSTRLQTDAPLKDKGPAAPPKAKAGIDGTIGLWRALGLSYRVGATYVDFRVIDGAKSLPKEIREKAGLP